MEIQQKKPGVLLGVVMGMAAALSAFFSLLAPLAPGFMAYLGLVGGAVPMLLSLVVAGVGLYLFAGVTGLYLFAIVAAGTLLLYALMKKQTPWFDTIVFVSFVLIAGLYAMFCLPDILAGRGAFTTVKEVFASFWSMYAEQMNAAGSLLGQDMAEQYDALGRMILAELPATFPFSLCALGCCFGFSDTIIARALAKKQGASLRPMVRFSLWRLPKGYLLGAAVLWLGSALCAYLGVYNADAISLCCAAAAFLPLAMQGVCTLAFLFTIRKARASMYVPLIILLLFTFPYCLMALALFGITEQLLKLRAKVMGAMQGPK